MLRGDFVKTACVALFAALTALMSLQLRGRVHVVKGSSMNPAVCSGSLIVRINRTPQRGALVIVRLTRVRQHMIKRVLALPGDTITYHGGVLRAGANGGGFAIGVVAADPPEEWHYAYTPMAFRRTEGTMTSWNPLAVSTDGYFVLGDDLVSSGDSRSFGLIERREILGTALVLRRAGCQNG